MFNLPASMGLTDILSLAIAAILVNNYILVQFLGCCSFFGVSKKTDTALGMGMAVIFVMAIASAAHALGYEPYWMDLNSYGQTTCTKVIGAQNDLYSMGSRLSQKSRLFNRLVWEPMNYEGFRKLTYNAADQKNAELMAPVYANIPKDIPVVATHVWPAQAALHAGMKYVVNAIPDNWQMALHLAEGSIHTVQTLSLIHI